MSFPPLRSTTDRSNTGYVLDADTDRRQIECHIDGGGTVHALPRQAGLLVRARYAAFEGVVSNGPHLRVGLCTGPATRMVQQIGAARLEGLWRSGTLTIAPPQSAGFATSGPVNMIGLAILPNAFGVGFDLDRLYALAAGFQRDALIASVLTALYHEADTHGASTAFFEHGIAVILRRLREQTPQRTITRSVRPLSRARYERLVDYVGAHMGYDLAVADMAAVVGIDPSGFNRALRARTGLAPFAWLTQYRMEQAARLLAGGLSVTQVAGRVGYANASKFAAAFRRLHGISPSYWCSTD